MVHKINNGNIYISVESLGAELRSLCDVHGTEYLWQGYETQAEGRSPIIFPIIDGIATSSNFRVHEKLSDKLVLRIEDNAKTLDTYPFKFCLDISYELSGNSMYVRFKVTNTGEKAMPYVIGAQPTFSVPIEYDEEFYDYYLKFDCVENCAPLLQNTQYVKLNHDMFSGGALILNNLKSRGVELLSENSGRGIRIDFEGFDNLALLQVNQGNFLCIAPCTFSNALSDKDLLLGDAKGIINLNPSETDERGYKVTFI